MESGKGKCSYDPKLNSVSALISEYHLASGYRHGPALALVITACSQPACFFTPFICPSICGYLKKKCFMVHVYLLYVKTARTSKPNHCILPIDVWMCFKIKLKFLASRAKRPM